MRLEMDFIWDILKNLEGHQATYAAFKQNYLTAHPKTDRLIFILLRIERALHSVSTYSRDKTTIFDS